MITIVTGKINAGKTTCMLNLFEQTPNGGGIISTKNMHGSLVHSYEAMSLVNKELRPLMLHKQFADFPLEGKQMIGPYIINEATIKWAEHVINQLVITNQQPLYIDEIGLLELSNGGFHQILESMLKSRLDIILTTRIDLLPKVIERYRINEYQLIELT